MLLSFAVCRSCPCCGVCTHIHSPDCPPHTLSHATVLPTVSFSLLPACPHTHQNTRKQWNRDRFVLSNGHACALQYAMLHLTGYDVTLDDLKNFRQLGSRYVYVCEPRLLCCYCVGDWLDCVCLRCVKRMVLCTSHSGTTLDHSQHSRTSRGAPHCRH